MYKPVCSWLNPNENKFFVIRWNSINGVLYLLKVSFAQLIDSQENGGGCIRGVWDGSSHSYERRKNKCNQRNVNIAINLHCRRPHVRKWLMFGLDESAGNKSLDKQKFNERKRQSCTICWYTEAEVAYYYMPAQMKVNKIGDLQPIPSSWSLKAAILTYACKYI